MTTDKVTPAEAQEIAAANGVSVTIVTIHEWCSNRGIGTKIGGRWYINRKRLMWLLEGRTWPNTKEQDEK